MISKLRIFFKITMANQTTTIPKGWKTTTLGNIPESWNLEIAESFCEKVADGTHATPKPVERGKYLITSKHIKDGRVDLSSAYKISENDFIEINKRSKVNQWDVLFSMIGTVGEIALIDRVPDYAIKNVGLFKCGEESRAKWLYYFLRGKIGQDEIQRRINGTTQSYVTLGDLRSFPLIIPSSSTELKAIVAVLSSLDDKIELLREQNKTLEATAQAIFKEWFVNFNFPGTTGKMIDSAHGKIPEGWRVGKIEDLCKKLASGGTPATINKDYYGGDIDWFSTKELQDNFIFESDKKITKAGLENSSAKVFPKGSVVMAIYAAPTVGRLGILGKDATFNQAACGFVADEAIASNEYIYLLLLSLRDDFNGLANGAAQQNLNVGLVKNFAIIIPDKIIMAQFKAIIVPIFGKMLNNTSQIQTLSTLRDLLLPKLMKGKVRVKI